MAATDAPATLSELRTDFLNAAKDVTGVAAVNTIVDRYLNKANHDIHQEPWWWAERRAVIRTKVPYTTGTIAVTQGATAVTGTTTAWATADAYGENNAAVGHKITLGSDLTVHLISAVGSATSITLTDRYTGSTITSGGGYAVYQDEYAVAADFGSLLDTRFFDSDRTIRLIGAAEFYREFPRNAIRGKPRVATLIELGPSGAVTLRRRVLFGPAPDAAYQIPYRYSTTNIAVSSTGTGAANLSANTDEPIIPIRFRESIVYKALELWARDRKDDSRAGEYQASYAGVMLRARQAYSLAEERPRIQPRLGPYRAAAWPVRASRLASGSRWDQLLD